MNWEEVKIWKKAALIYFKVLPSICLEHQNWRWWTNYQWGDQWL